MKTIDEMIAVMTAYKEGKQIEWKLKNIKDDTWEVCVNPVFNFNDAEYRVKEIEKEYIDMGLPSGNIWTVDNEIVDDKSYFTYDEAVEKFGGSLPTKEDFQELLECCYHRWDKERCGIEFISEDRNKLFFQAVGCCNDFCKRILGYDGLYWSSTPTGPNCAFYLNFYRHNANVGYGYRNISKPVRLIKRK